MREARARIHSATIRVRRWLFEKRVATKRPTPWGPELMTMAGNVASIIVLLQ
jgi:hypothetical protein